VSQFDHADVSELELARKKLKTEAAKRSLKLTPIAFLFRAVALTLRLHPKINASLLNDGQNIVYKDYVHIGMAVDTPAGLVVPVIRDTDKKDIWVLAAEITELAEKARTRKLKQQEMQGGSFTISSLGGIGGMGFTPIINAPESAILGVSRMHVGPQWDGKAFIPRTLLPLSLSYDHRIINGADAGRFMADLLTLLSTPKDILKSEKKDKKANK
jgi:pyruvate dehydrogenase E2 component (dihydrolipoamide acetyltransferase)